MGLLDQAGPWLAGMLQQAGGREATYRRGAESLTLTVVPGKSLFAISAPAGSARVVWGDADFLFDAADLILGGEQVTPVKGDRITLTLEGEVRTFEASTPTGEKVWRFGDPQETQIRLHTKRV